MTRQFILRARAEHDIQSAFEWYETQCTGLGGEFLVALRKRLEAVRVHPESNPVLYRDIRRAVVPRFPYLIFIYCSSGAYRGARRAAPRAQSCSLAPSLGEQMGSA